MLNSLGASISVIDPVSWKETKRRPTGKEPYHLRFSPDMLFGTANFKLRFDPTGVRDQVEAGRDYGRGFWSQQ